MAVPSMFGGAHLADERQAVANIIPIRFWIKYREVGGGQLKAEEWVLWEKIGSNIKFQVPMKIDRLKKAAQRAKENQDFEDESFATWKTLEPYYDNWKSNGTEEVISGTPLSIWTGITHDVVEALRHFNIRSVEDLSVANDSVLNRVPDPNIMRYRERARKFLATKDIANAVRDLDESQAQLNSLKQEFESLRKALADEAKARREAEAALEEATPMPARKRRNGKEATVPA